MSLDGPLGRRVSRCGRMDEIRARTWFGEARRAKGFLRVVAHSVGLAPRRRRGGASMAFHLVEHQHERHFNPRDLAHHQCGPAAARAWSIVRRWHCRALWAFHATGHRAPARVSDAGVEHGGLVVFVDREPRDREPITAKVAAAFGKERPPACRKPTGCVPAVQLTKCVVLRVFAALQKASLFPTGATRAIAPVPSTPRAKRGPSFREDAPCWKGG